MRAHELLSLFVHARDVGLQLGFLDPPLTPATNFDRSKIATANEGIGLRGRNIEHVTDVGECQKAWHEPILPPGGGISEVSSTGVASLGLQQGPGHQGCAREGPQVSFPDYKPK